MVMDAHKNPEYDGVLNILDDDIFALVEKFVAHGRIEPPRDARRQARVRSRARDPQVQRQEPADLERDL
jgi:hypothetical protein